MAGDIDSNANFQMIKNSSLIDLGTLNVKFWKIFQIGFKN